MLAALYIEKGHMSESTYVQEQADNMVQACQNQEQISVEEIKLLTMLCDVSRVSRTAAPAA